MLDVSEETKKLSVKQVEINTIAVGCPAVSTKINNVHK